MNRYLSQFSSILIICALSITTNFIGVKTAVADNLEECVANQENFGFTLPDYPIEHQGWAMLDITVDYRMAPTSPNEIKPEIYPNFVPIVEKIDKFMKDYPNETDYWEILNKKLAQSILEEYPTIVSIKIRIDVKKTLGANYNRHSIITMTKPNSCPIL